MENRPPSSKVAMWAKRVGPWVIAVAIVVVLTRRYSPAEVLVQLRAGSWQAAMPYPFLFPFVYLFMGGVWDTLILQRVLRVSDGGELKRPRFVDVIRGRAGTAVLMLLGYFFGHGGMGVWLARKTGASARSVSGAVSFMMLSDLAALGLVATAATTLGHAEVPNGVRIVAISVAAVPIAFTVLGPTVIAKTRGPFLVPWRELPRSTALLQIVGRAANISFVVLITWTAARAFGLDIPLASFATYMPVVLLVTALPLNVGGMGAAQAAWLVFLPWATGEKLLAFQLVWQLFFGLGIVVRGTPFVKGVAREITG